MASLPSKLAPVSPVGEAPGLANERKTIVFRFTVRSGQPETDAHLSSKLRDKKNCLPLKKRTSHARIVNFERSVGAGRVSLLSSSQPASRLDEDDGTAVSRGGGREGCRRRRQCRRRQWHLVGSGRLTNLPLSLLTEASDPLQIAGEERGNERQYQ